MPFILVILFFQSVWAGEPDDMLAREAGGKAHLANENINTVVNGILDQRVEAYNRRYKTGSCNREKLYDALTDTFDRNFPDIKSNIQAVTPMTGPKTSAELPYKLSKGVDNCASKHFATVPFSRWSFARSVKVKAKGKTFYMGIDKFEHFFGHGYNYWQTIGKNPRLPKEEVERALDWGTKQEDSIWGLKCYGVKSYGDMAANYQGLLFWSQLLDGKNPYLVCKNGQYKRVRDFNIADYANESMDESVNCNSYDSEKTLESLRIVWNKRGLSCPAAEADCKKLRSSYPDYVAKKILHPRCLETGNSQVEPRGSMSISETIDAVKALGNSQIPIPRREEPTQNSGAVK